MESFNDRNKERIAGIITYLLNPNNNIPENLIKRVLNDVLWSATADFSVVDDFKYRLPIWSDGAIEFYPEYLTNGRKGLRHEHLFPKKLLKVKLLELEPENLNDEIVYQLLLQYSHSAVVTIEDDATLNNNGFNQNIPNDYEGDDFDEIQVLFSRYIESDINLKFVDWRIPDPFDTGLYYLNNRVINYEFINHLEFNNWA